MKQKVLLVFILLQICVRALNQQPTPNAVLHLSVPSIHQNRVVLKIKKDNAYVACDSTYFQSGRATLTTHIDEPTYAMVESDQQIKLILLVPGRNLLQAAQDSALNSSVLRNTLSNDFDEYQETISYPVKRELINLSQARRRFQANSAALDSIGRRQRQIESESAFAIRSFIRRHRRSFLSVLLLDNYLQAWEPDTISSLFSNLVRVKNNYPTVRRIKAYLSQFKENGTGSVFSFEHLKWHFNGTGNVTAKFYIVDFWGSWCTPCMNALPELKQAYSSLKEKGVEFIGVACENEGIGTFQKLQELVVRQQIIWPQTVQYLNDSSASNLINNHQVRAYPTYFLLDKDHRILLRGVGTEGFDKIMLTLKNLL